MTDSNSSDLKTAQPVPQGILLPEPQVVQEPEPQPDLSGLEEARQFLNTLFGRYFATARTSLVEVRYFATNGNVISRWLEKGELKSGHWDDIVDYNSSHHISFGVCPRPASKLKEQKYITDVVCLWVDIDGKDCPGREEEALTRAQAFSLQPTIVVDSGHGIHCYWVLKEPLVGIDKDTYTNIKQTLSGLIKALGADTNKKSLEAVLRLPGTNNVKNIDPKYSDRYTESVPCKVISSTDKLYSLGDFAEYRDVSWTEDELAGGGLRDFGSLKVILHKTTEDYDKLAAQVEKMKLTSHIKRLILTGELVAADGDKYPSRSERDYAIMCALVRSGYDYETILSVCTNPLLKSAERFINGGPKLFEKDLRRALARTKRDLAKEPKEAAAISAIRHLKGEGVLADDRRKMIEDYTAKDLFTGGEPLGKGFQHAEDDERFYFFHSGTKEMMDFESTSFETLLNYRYRIAERELEFITTWLKTVIAQELHTKVTPRTLGHWDKDRQVLYVSDHKNGIYRLDGERIERFDNGTDGVFFEANPSLVPWEYDSSYEPTNYFRNDRKYGARLGLSLEKLFEYDPATQKHRSLLYEHLLSWGNFTPSSDSPIAPWQQRLLVTIYFYSLFFESLVGEDKPLLCLLGTQFSGKSFLLTLLGRILNGETFRVSSKPKSAHDLAVVMSYKHYMVLDNVDEALDKDIINSICTSTGAGAEESRELWTSRGLQSVALRCFLAISTRTPKFANDRPDIVSRLLLLTTDALTRITSSQEILNPMLRDRNKLLTEVLVNLNTIVRMLRDEKERNERVPLPPADTRVRYAAWSAFGRTICGAAPAAIHFYEALKAMGDRKATLSIEESLQYEVLYQAIYVSNYIVDGKSPAMLFSILTKVAEEMKLVKDFQRVCGSTVALGKWLGNNLGELRHRFDITIFKRPNCQREYTIRPWAPEGEEVGPDTLATETHLYDSEVFSLLDCSSVEEADAVLKEMMPGQWQRRGHIYRFDTRVVEEG